MAEAAKIGIIGNGNVGRSLREGLAGAGYEVASVGREPERVREIVQGCDVVFLAVPFAERQNAIKAAGKLDGKIIIDVTNALDKNNDFALDLRRSGAEEVQQMAQGAKVVKSFNMVFASNMKKGKANGERLTLFVAGDDNEAKRKVLDIGRDLGFDPVDSGPLKNARWLETLGYLNIQLGFGQDMGTDAGFRYVHPRAS